MRIMISLVFITAITNVYAGTVADFEDLNLGVESNWSGQYSIDDIGGNLEADNFRSGSAVFENHSDGDWNIWAGFAYSNKTDTSTAGFMNQFSSYAGGAHSGSNFAVGYYDSYNNVIPKIVFDDPMRVSGIYVTNTTYTALDMLNGNPGFSKKFGGISGNDADWFLLTVTGRNSAGDITGAPVEFYLADYRFANNGMDYILDIWSYVDLSSLGAIKSLEFAFSSSDNSDWGMNTPAYFALDSIVVPEPATLILVGMGGLILRKKRRQTKIDR